MLIIFEKNIQRRICISYFKIKKIRYLAWKSTLIKSNLKLIKLRNTITKVNVKNDSKYGKRIRMVVGVNLAVLQGVAGIGVVINYGI